MSGIQKVNGLLFCEIYSLVTYVVSCIHNRALDTSMCNCVIGECWQVRLEKNTEPGSRLKAYSCYF